jgi:hypothetical protein
MINNTTIKNVVRGTKSRKIRWVGEGGENVYTILVEKSEGKSPLGRPRCRWEGNVRMDLIEIS